MTLAEKPRLAVGAAILERGKHKADEREPVEIRSEFRNISVVRPQHADRRAAHRQLGMIGEETRGVHLRTDFPETDDLHWKRRI